MSMEVVSFTMRIQANAERDLDRQVDNLMKIQGYIDHDFERGWFGDPDHFVVQFAPSCWGSAKTLAAIDRAINKARRVKSNDDCQMYHDDFERCLRRDRERTYQYMKNGGMKIYFSPATPEA